MCGRSALALDPEEIRYQLGGVPWYDEDLYQPRYNVAPSHFQPVIIHKKAAQDIERKDERISKANAKQYTDEVGEVHTIEVENPSVAKNQDGLECMKGISKFLKIKSMRWGLIPSWSANGGNKSGAYPVNIRDDSLTTHNKPMFKRLKERNRCLVVTQGFYEWKRSGTGKTATKVPYFSHLASKKNTEIMLMGALYDQCKIKGEIVYSYAIVTTSANEEFSPIHDRMPLIFDPIEDQDEIINWLSPITPFNDTIKDIIHPLESELNTYEVSSEVNNSKNESPSFIVPVSEVKGKISSERPTTLTSFFKKEAKDQMVHPKIKKRKVQQEGQEVYDLSDDNSEIKNEVKQEEFDKNVVSLIDSD